MNLKSYLNHQKKKSKNSVTWESFFYDSYYVLKSHLQYSHSEVLSLPIIFGNQLIKLFNNEVNINRMWSCSIAGIDINKMPQFQEYIEETTEEINPEDDMEHFNEILKVLNGK